MHSFRSSVTGRYVTREFAKAHPRITIRETDRGVRRAVQEPEAEEVPLRQQAGGSEEVRQPRASYEQAQRQEEEG